MILSSKFRSAAFAACCVAAAGQLPAQDAGQNAPNSSTSGVSDYDWRMPFRYPTQDIAPPEKLFAELRTMYARAKLAPDSVYVDERGIRMSDDPEWQAAHRRLMAVQQDIGYLSLIIRESGSVEDRELALYGMFHHPDTAAVMQMLNHIPGEPVRQLREDNYRRAIDLLRVQFPKKNPGDLEEWSKLRVGPAGQLPPKPGDYSFGFDAIPYFMLLSVDSPIDQRQAMWFLTQLVEIRPELRQTFLAAAAPPLAKTLVHDDNAVRASAREFLHRLDAERRDPPPADASDEQLQEWLQDVLYSDFPPIRPISPGLLELYPSEELDAILARGEEVLRDGSLGDTAHGTLASGTPYRGLRIARAPAPLDQLGLQVGSIITSLNGVPVADCAELLAMLRAQPHVRAFLVEYVEGGRMHAKEFAWMK